MFFRTGERGTNLESKPLPGWTLAHRLNSPTARPLHPSETDEVWSAADTRSFQPSALEVLSVAIALYCRWELGAESLDVEASPIIGWAPSERLENMDRSCIKLPEKAVAFLAISSKRVLV